MSNEFNEEVNKSLLLLYIIYKYDHLSFVNIENFKIKI